MLRAKSLVRGLLAAVLIGLCMGTLHARVMGDFVGNNGGSDGYGDWHSQIVVDEDREWAYSYGEASVYAGKARVDVWISGGVYRDDDEALGYVDVYTDADYKQSPAVWCGIVSATGVFWQIDTWGEWEWHLLSGWQDSAAEVDAGDCPEW